MEYKNAIEQLLDEENSETVYLKSDETGEIEAFEQMALVPFDNALYAILMRKDDFDAGNFDNGGMVFKIDEKKQKVTIVEDDNVIYEVFDIYDRMFEEGQN